MSNKHGHMKNLTFKRRIREKADRWQLPVAEVSPLGRRLMAAKLLAGYKPTAAASSGILALLPTVSMPEASFAVCLGHHVNNSVVRDLSRWLTACLYAGVGGEAFTRFWESFLEAEDEDGDAEALGWTYTADEELSWLDEMDSSACLARFYTRTATEGVDRFLSFSDSRTAYAYLIACKGAPARQLILRLLDSGGCVN